MTAHLAKTVAGWPFEKPGGRTLVMLIPLIALIHDDMATWHRRAVLRSATAAQEAPVAARHVSEPPDTPAPTEPRETEASKMSFLSVFSFGGSPTSQDTPTPVQPAADEVVEIKVEAPAPEPAVEVKKEEPQPAPAKKACCVVC